MATPPIDCRYWWAVWRRHSWPKWIYVKCHKTYDSDGNTDLPPVDQHLLYRRECVVCGRVEYRAVHPVRVSK